MFVTGPESSGSKLIAKIVAHVLSVHEYGSWNAVGWSNSDQIGGNVSEAAMENAASIGSNLVCHRSIPYKSWDLYPDIHQWMQAIGDRFEPRFVLPTRDMTIVDLSKKSRFGQPDDILAANRVKSREIITEIMNGPHPWMLWSYETFMYLRQSYLMELYRFLGVTSSFMPTDLDDGNRKYLPQAERI